MLKLNRPLRRLLKAVFFGIVAIAGLVIVSDSVMVPLDNAGYFVGLALAYFGGVWCIYQLSLLFSSTKAQKSK